MPSTRSTLNHQERARSTRLNTGAVLVLSLLATLVVLALLIALGMAAHHALASLADHLNGLSQGQSSQR